MIIPSLVKNSCPFAMEKLFAAAKIYTEQLSKMTVCCLSSFQVPELGVSSLPISDLAKVSIAVREKENIYVSTGKCLLSCDVSRSSYHKK